MSRRGDEWVEFAGEVLDHIEDYTLPQYGDLPNDNCAEWTAEDCIRQIQKYANRFGKNQRPGNDKLDLLKIAHYACIAHAKIEETE